MNAGCSLPNLGFTLHSSVRFKGFITYWKESIQAMRELEGGVIANPTEGRQVGHYWLQKSSLTSTERKKNTESWLSLEGLAEKVAQQGFTDLLMVEIGGSALGPQIVEWMRYPPKGLRFLLLTIRIQQAWIE